MNTENTYGDFTELVEKVKFRADDDGYEFFWNVEDPEKKMERIASLKATRLETVEEINELVDLRIEVTRCTGGIIFKTKNIYNGENAKTNLSYWLKAEEEGVLRPSCVAVLNLINEMENK